VLAELEPLYRYFSGDVEVPTASTTSGMTFHVSAPSADHLRGCADGWPRPGSTVQFVTDGIESAVARAKSAAARSPWECTAPKRSSRAWMPDYSTRSTSIWLLCC
jgi:hypothetical protein